MLLQVGDESRFPNSILPATQIFTQSQDHRHLSDCTQPPAVCISNNILSRIVVFHQSIFTLNRLRRPYSRPNRNLRYVLQWYFIVNSSKWNVIWNLQIPSPSYRVHLHLVRCPSVFSRYIILFHCKYIHWYLFEIIQSNMQPLPLNKKKKNRGHGDSKSRSKKNKKSSRRDKDSKKRRGKESKKRDKRSKKRKRKRKHKRRNKGVCDLQ